MSMTFNEIHNEGKNHGYTNKLFKQLIVELKRFTGTNYSDIFDSSNWYEKAAWENHITHASREWKNFDWKSAYNIIKNSMPEKYADIVIKYLPKGYKETQEMIAKLKGESIPSTAKPLKLKEDTDYQIAYKYFEKGHKEGYSKELFKKLIQKSLDAQVIELVKGAINYWPKFNSIEAEEILNNFKPKNLGYDYYLENFRLFLGKGIKSTKQKIELLKNTSTKLETKPYKLKEWIESRGQI